jgi:hypothetical protein
MQQEDIIPAGMDSRSGTPRKFEDPAEVLTFYRFCTKRRLQMRAKIVFIISLIVLMALSAMPTLADAPEFSGLDTANGWYEGEEIYYEHLGIEEGVTSRGENDIYLIGGDRMYQANVVETIPGEAGYSPHWNVYVVFTADGVTVDDILASPWASEHYPEALFDDVGDLRAARDAGLVTFFRPGVVVLCPIVPEEAAEAPGKTPLTEDFPPFPEAFPQPE